MLQRIINMLNDLRPRQLLMLALGAAVLMFFAIYASMSFLNKEEGVAEDTEKKAIEMTTIVVAKTNIPPRTRIQENMLQLKEMPVDIVPEGAIKRFADVLDVQVKVSIFAGDILTIQKVFAEKTDEGFIATIPLDCRAVSISVNDITGVAGFAKPGDFVDLLLVEKSSYSATTNILLQNVQLLSINKDMTGSTVLGENGALTTTTPINNPTIATFALQPEDVLKLISATKLGEIYMTLRPSKPKNNYVPAMEYTLESVNMPPPEPEPEPVYVQQQPVETPVPAIPETPVPVMPLPQLPATPAVPKIEIIQGDQVTQEAEEAFVPSAMPIIPSGVEAPIASSPVVSSSTASRSSKKRSTPNIAAPLANTPLANSHVADTFSN